MINVKRLSDAELEIMKVIWNSEPPITTLQIMSKLESEKSRKPQTLLTMLVRLIEKSFLKSEKVGKERNYAPEISEQEYLQAETGNFIKRYYGNSLGSLVKTMYEGKELSQEDLQELREWLSEKE